MKKSKIKVILIFAFCILDLLGCATIIETTKGFWGVSTKALEDGRKDALVRQFNYDYNSCYAKVKEALAISNFHIYAQSPKKKMLAIYLSKEDTTPVGLFLKEIDANHTQVEVSSPSTYAKEFIYHKVVLWLEKPTKVMQKEEPSGAKEDIQDK